MLQRYRMLVFATVVQPGALIAAAQTLNISHSMVSQYLQKLQQCLRCRLSYRPSRAIGLADNNREFFGNCTKLRQLATQAERHCHSTTHAPSNSGNCR
ncbi:LysR family transcriptional regulator [Shewanella fodinae]|uniref:LysR family transcriptional regulator n=1 Tax=Shewanella fodinae TaxID=552357 RepID=UPI00105547ED|nr:LysR family transcriptional regulator [Shewanella fodinae]